MSKPFDATLNRLIDVRPEDWARCFAKLVGIPFGPCKSLDTDLATTVQADRIFRIDGRQPSILHLEFEANPRLGIPRDLWRYNTLIDLQHDLPVHTVLILLRAKAIASDQTGVYRRLGAKGKRINEFSYHVEKVWDRPLDFWFRHGLGLAPLALLTDDADKDLEGSLSRFREYLQQSPANTKTTSDLLGSSYVLCGLRHDPERVSEMYRRLSMLMEDSATYQEILKKGLKQGLDQGIKQGLDQGIKQGLDQGIKQGLDQGIKQGHDESRRSLMMRIAKKQLGRPAARHIAKLDAISDSTRFEFLAVRCLDVSTWDQLLEDD